METSRRHGFDVNFAAGKTKALIRWAAKESVKRRRDVTNDDGSCTIPVFGDQTLLTSIVGLHTSPAGFLEEEVAYKSAGAATATKALMRLVLTRKSLPISVSSRNATHNIVHTTKPRIATRDCLAQRGPLRERGQDGRLEINLPEQRTTKKAPSPN